ncbi:aminoglycoside phosphotransferase family protein [Psychrobacter sp. I-STPA6b]|uniref:aminoglycoside phosphotransferase family protein n=1 Tax=Psychrobacter sp. I-STPA6b TaxID=2585718 RepID=UPI001D0C0524|nr:phosphotransferase [Psychrobacter sp. I-STPA6b]
MSQNTSSASSNFSVEADLHTQRVQQLTDWLQSVFVDQPFRLESLPGDASFRRYHRLYLTPTTESIDGEVVEEVRYIIMDAPPEKESITEFVLVDEVFASVINVPTIIAKDLSQGFLVLQDFGTTEFAHLLRQFPQVSVSVNEQLNKSIDEYYQWAMQTLIDLQELSVQVAQEQAQLPYYDDKKLCEEMALFTDWFLPYLNISMPEHIQQAWRQMTQWLVENIRNQPQVVVHRDYHSRNLMLDRENPEELGVIDFQDAVIGAYSYDLVSLVRDAYVNWDESTISKWIEDFWKMQKQAGLQAADDVQTFYQDVNMMGVQRHLKVLGIFVRLAQRDGKLRYLADIPKVMKDLRFELNWLQEETQASEALTLFTQWLENDVVPIYEQSFTL